VRAGHVPFHVQAVCPLCSCALRVLVHASCVSCVCMQAVCPYACMQAVRDCVPSPDQTRAACEVVARRELARHKEQEEARWQVRAEAGSCLRCDAHSCVGCMSNGCECECVCLRAQLKRSVLRCASLPHSQANLEARFGTVCLQSLSPAPSEERALCARASRHVRLPFWQADSPFVCGYVRRPGRSSTRARWSGCPISGSCRMAWMRWWLSPSRYVRIALALWLPSKASPL